MSTASELLFNTTEERSSFGSENTATTEVKKEEFISDKDQLVFATVRMQKDLSLSNAEKALAQHEASKLAYSNIILQLTIKYKIEDGDILKEDGSITRK